jgi:hypothetical protein
MRLEDAHGHARLLQRRHQVGDLLAHRRMELAKIRIRVVRIDRFAGRPHGSRAHR